MKRKHWLWISAAVLLIPVPVKADMFGGDVAVLGQILIQSVKQVLQGAQMVSQGLKAYEQTRAAAAFVRSPGAWKTMLVNAAAATGSTLGKPSMGSDLAALAQLTEGRQTALQAMRQIAGDPNWQPTAENTATLSLLHMQAVNTTIEMNRMQADLQFKQNTAMKEQLHVPDQSNFDAHAGGWVPK